MTSPDQPADHRETGLIDGTRLSKDAARIEALGAVDELSCVLGAARAETPPQGNLPDDVDSLLASLQNDLATMGAELATGDPSRLKIPLLSDARVEALEEATARHQRSLPPLTELLLPAGTRAAAALHHARAVCRRAERRVVTLGRDDRRVSSTLAGYLNRLSDLRFTLARGANDRAGRGDVPWRRVTG